MKYYQFLILIFVAVGLAGALLYLQSRQSSSPALEFSGAPQAPVNTSLEIIGLPKGANVPLQIESLGNNAIGTYTTVTYTMTNWTTLLTIPINSSLVTTYQGNVPYQFQGAGTTITYNSTTYTINESSKLFQGFTLNPNDTTALPFYAYFNAMMWNAQQANELEAIGVSANSPIIVGLIGNTTNSLTYGTTFNGNVQAANTVDKYATYNNVNGAIDFIKTNVTKQENYICINLTSTAFSGGSYSLCNPGIAHLPWNPYAPSAPSSIQITAHIISKLIGGQTLPYNILIKSGSNVLLSASNLNTNSISDSNTFTYYENEVLNITGDGLGNSNYTYEDPSVITPANIIYYVPITITNFQTTAFVNNAPIAIGVSNTAAGLTLGVNTIPYQAYFSPNDTNYEFFDAGGNVITSWMEGNILNETTWNGIATSSTSSNAPVMLSNILWWVQPNTNIYSQLTANTGTPTQATIYLGFAGNLVATSGERSANYLMDGHITGEASQLSCDSDVGLTICDGISEQAGINDNGNYLFGNGPAGGPGSGGWLANFSARTFNWGTSFLANAVTGTSTASTTLFGDSLVLHTIATANRNVTVYSLNTYPANQITALLGQTGISSGNPAFNLRMGLATTTVALGTINLENSYFIQATQGPAFTLFYIQTALSTITNLVSTSNSVVALNSPATLDSFSWLKQGSELGSGDYMPWAASTDSTLSFGKVAGYVGLVSAGATARSVWIQWIREQVAPPNGINPGTTLGAIVPVTAQPSVTSWSVSNTYIDSGQTETLSLSISGGTAPYTYNFYVSNIGTPSTIVLFNSLSSSSTSVSNTFVANAMLVSNSVDQANVVITGTGATAINTIYLNIYAANAFMLAGNTVSNSLADQLQYETINAIWSGGTSTYTANFMIENSINGNIIANALYTGLSGTNNAFKFQIPQTNNALGTENAIIILTDSATTNEIITTVNTITVNSLLVAGVPTASNSVIDNGQSTTITSHASGGTLPYSAYQWYTGAACTSAIGGATSSTYTVSPTSTTTYYYLVTDSATTANTACSSGVTVTVNTAFTLTTNSVSNSIADQLQYELLTAGWSGGTSKYEANYLIVNSVNGNIIAQASYTGLTGTSNTFTFQIPQTNNALGTENVIFTLSDSASTNSVITSVNTITVKPTLLSTSWIASNAVLDYNQYQLLTASLSGGTSQYTYNLLVYNAMGSLIANQLTPLTSSTSNTYFFQINPSWLTGTYTANVIITDSATSNAVVTNTLTFIVDTALNANPPTPTTATIDNGQSITLTANPTGGTTPYTYQWYTDTTNNCLSLSIIGGATSSTYVASPTSNTYYCYIVTDSATVPAVATSSGPANIIVNSAFATPTISISNTILDVGQWQIFTGGESGGTSAYTYNFLIVNSVTKAIISNKLFTNVASTSNVFTYQTTSTDTTNSPEKGNVIVTDNAYSPKTGNSIYTSNYFIYPDPTVTITATPSNSGNYNTLIVVNVVVSGGSGTFSFSNTINNIQTSFTSLTSNTESFTICGAPASTANCLAAGTYTFNVIATDTGTTTPYVASLAANVVVINQATPTITVTGGGTQTYTGNPFSLVATISTLGNQLQANDYINGVLITNFFTSNTYNAITPGTYNVFANTLGNGNYLSGFAQNTLTISSTSPPVLIFSTGNAITYNTLDKITANVFGTDGANIIIGSTQVASGTNSIAYTVCASPATTANCLAVGTYTVTAWDTTLNTNTVNTLVISQATPTILVTGAQTYTWNGFGSILTASISSLGNQVTANDYITGQAATYAQFTTSNAWLTPSSVGTWTLTANSQATANYLAVSAISNSITINANTPVLTFSNGNSITYGIQDMINGFTSNADGSNIIIGSTQYASSASNSVSYTVCSTITTTNCIASGTYTVKACDTVSNGCASNVMVIVQASPGITVTGGGAVSYSGSPFSLVATITTIGNQLQANDYINGALITNFFTSNTYNAINPNTYTLLANTLGNGNYLTNSISNTLTINAGTSPTLTFSAGNSVAYGILDTLTVTGTPSSDATNIIIGTTQIVAGSGQQSYSICASPATTANCLGVGTYIVTAWDTSLGTNTVNSLVISQALPSISVVGGGTEPAGNYLLTATVITVGNQLQANDFANGVAYNTFYTSNIVPIYLTSGSNTVIANTLGNGNYLANTASATLTFETPTGITVYFFPLSLILIGVCFLSLEKKPWIMKKRIPGIGILLFFSMLIFAAIGASIGL